ncbi:MAG: methyltransferase domain-containing protein [Oscillospiraceae bacterium]|nr:methyltransferase domain-containing protein [Oscillospiraceae bacterium]
MNIVWSSYVQGIDTLYLSRKLRFADIFADRFKHSFKLDESKPLKVLEIGCGPGALAAALHRWYPNAEITAIDRDSEFIRFASEQEKDVRFLEGDATALPFTDESFDVTISNTVSEHIEPSKFFGEQMRVLKPGGVCLVLSSRRGINIAAECTVPDEREEEFWKRVSQYDDSMEKYSVCQYPMSEAELPTAAEQYGFQNVSVGYVTVDLTPDDPKYPAQMARDMINAHRGTKLDAFASALRTMPERVSAEEIEELKAAANIRYDKRLELYEHGEKQWDTNVNIIMVVRGVK